MDTLPGFCRPKEKPGAGEIRAINFDAVEILACFFQFFCYFPCCKPTGFQPKKVRHQVGDLLVVTMADMGLVLLVNEIPENWIFFCDLSFLRPKRLFCGRSISVATARARGIEAEVKPLRIRLIFYDLLILC